MRLRVLALPAGALGTATAHPFLLVFDRCATAECAYLRDSNVKGVTGAEGVLVFDEAVELDDRQMWEVDEVSVRALRAAIVGF